MWWSSSTMSTSPAPTPRRWPPPSAPVWRRPASAGERHPPPHPPPHGRGLRPADPEAGRGPGREQLPARAARPARPRDPARGALPRVLTPGLRRPGRDPVHLRLLPHRRLRAPPRGRAADGAAGVLGPHLQAPATTRGAGHPRHARRGAAVPPAEHLAARPRGRGRLPPAGRELAARSEEHTSELQSRENLVCRLLLEKKK